jgi:predicted TIM-barrel fold metal-dependent hydrolase
VGRLLERSPNLWAELSYRLEEVAPGGRLAAAWRGLFLRFPDRFLYGSDTWTPSRWPELPRIADSARNWLKELPPEVAEGIARRNAEALFGK